VSFKQVHQHAPLKESLDFSQAVLAVGSLHLSAEDQPCPADSTRRPNPLVDVAASRSPDELNKPFNDCDNDYITCRDAMPIERDSGVRPRIGAGFYVFPESASHANTLGSFWHGPNSLASWMAAFSMHEQN